MENIESSYQILSTNDEFHLGDKHTEEEYQELKRQLEEVLRKYNELEALLTKKVSPSEPADSDGRLRREDLSPLKHVEKAFENPNVDNLTALLEEVKNLSYNRNVVVRFSDMGYWTNISKSGINTVGSAMKSLLFGSGKKIRLDILKGLTGKISPGKMTLVIGPPGCGKSTFLKALSGRLHDSKAFLDGSITYNREDAKNNKNFLISKIVDYIDQDDTHAPTLTVFETLEFAWRCVSGGHHSYGIAKNDPVAISKLNALDEGLWRVNQLISILGLKTCKNTIVGNNMIRGVSGGQKKRVTTGEFMVTNARVKCFDSISNGLDSATTFDILRAIKLVCTIFNSSSVIALLQPSPEVIDLFDDIILMSAGQIIFHGPRSGIQDHFASLGYTCPADVDLADFLVQLPTPDGLLYKTVSVTSKIFVPHNTNALAAAFKTTSFFTSMAEDVHDTSGSTLDNESGWMASDSKPFAGDFWYYTGLMLRKQVVRLMRNTGLIRGRVGQTMIIGAIIASLFTNLATTDYRSMMGFIFFCALFLALGNFAFIPDMVAEKAVFFKHADALFYPTSSFVAAQTLVLYPLVMSEAFVFGSITYWSVGLTADNNGGRFITFVVLVLALSLNIGQLFSLIASVMPSIETAQPVCGLSLVFMLLFSGYICPFSNIPAPWIWVYYLNPIAWTIQALLINEFTASDYDFPFIPGSQTTFGTKVLDASGYKTDYLYVWYGLLFVVGEYLFFLVATTLVLTYFRTPPPRAPPVEIDGDGDIGGGEAREQRANMLPAPGPGLPFDPVSFNPEGNSPPSVATMSALSFQPVAFSFNDVWYTVQISKNEEIDLLRGVQGYFLPGTVTALMGSSGAGKTTLLDVLSGRKNTGTIKGTMAVNGKVKNETAFRHLMAYVEQFDTLFPRDTTREAIEFSAAMRLSRDVSPEDRKSWVEQVIDMMELTPIADRMIGNEASGGLSFEQKKRVSMAVEVVSNPSILFLDEPTTGLDSRGAQVLIRVIRRLAAQGRSIVCTIHQPSSNIFTSFDSLLLLRRGGQTVFFGPIGDQGLTTGDSPRNAASLIQYFESIPGVTPIAVNQNPASWMLDQLGAGTAGGTGQLVVDVHEYYKASSLGQANNQRVERLAQSGALVDEAPVDVTGQQQQYRLIDTYKQLMESRNTEEHSYTASEWTQFSNLFRRTVIGYWRSPQYNFSRMVVSVLVALIFSSVYSRQNYVTGNDLIARSAVQYITLLFCGIIAQVAVMPVVAAERPGFYREQESRMYRVIYFELAYFFVEIPYLAVSSLLFTLPFFFIVGFDKGVVAEKFFWYWLIQLLYTSVSVYTGHLLAAACPSLDIAAILMGMFSVFNSLFCGFYIASQNIPTFWEFVYWLSPLHYAFEAHIFVQSHGDTTIVTTLTGKLITAESFYPTVYQDWSYSNRGFDVMALVLFIVALRMLTFLALKYLRHQTK